jgi:hypothetical protein
MLDKVLEVGACFDWITPLITVVQDLANGPGHTFLIPNDCGWSGRDIEDLLRRRGVRSWGHMVVKHSLMLRVRQKQARWAQYLLERAGIPLEGGMVASSRAQAAGRTAQAPVQGRSRRGDGGFGETLRELGDLHLF